MIDDDEAERYGTGEHDEPARGEGRVADHRPAAGDDGLGAVGELEVAEDVRLGEAERALLDWALRQRQSGPGEPLLRFPKATPGPYAPPEPSGGVAPEPAIDAAPEPNSDLAQEPTRDVEPEPTPTSEAVPEYATETPPAPSGGESRSPWELLYDSAEEAISALVAAGGPDPRDFATPRLTRRAKVLIAVALVLLFVVSALGGFLGYRLTHRAAGGGPAAVGRLAQVRGGAV